MRRALVLVSLLASACVVAVARVFRALRREQVLPAEGSDLVSADGWVSPVPWSRCDSVQTYEAQALRGGLMQTETLSARCEMFAGHHGNHVADGLEWAPLVMDVGVPP